MLDREKERKFVSDIKEQAIFRERLEILRIQCSVDDYYLNSIKPLIWELSEKGQHTLHILADDFGNEEVSPSKLIQLLIELGYKVTYIPETDGDEDWNKERYYISWNNYHMRSGNPKAYYWG